MGRKGEEESSPCCGDAAARGDRQPPQRGELGEARQAQPGRAPRAEQDGQRGHAGPSPREGAPPTPPRSPAAGTRSVPHRGTVHCRCPAPPSQQVRGSSRAPGRGGVSGWGGGCPSPAAPWDGRVPRWWGGGPSSVRPVPSGRAGGRRGGRGSQLGLRVGLASVLSLTRHSLDLRLARDLQLGREAREPQSPSMEGVGSFPAGRAGVRRARPRVPALPPRGDSDHLSGATWLPCAAGAASQPRGGGCWGVPTPGCV